MLLPILPINLILGVLSTPPTAKDTVVRYTLVRLMRLSGQTQCDWMVKQVRLRTCRCPSCDARLQARKGDVNEHHFAHHDSSAELCEFALETSIRLMLLETLGQIQSISTPDFLWGKEIIIRGRENGGLAPGGHDGFGNGTAGWLAHPSRGSTNHVAPRLGCTVSLRDPLIFRDSNNSKCAAI